ncbi:MAG: hypothetical protein ABI625_25915 [bacterium]
MRARVTRTDELSGGPTLFAGLHSLAIQNVPSRFYLGLQLAAPAAIQLWSWGWKRSALWMVAASAFGVWALFEQKRDQASDTEMGNPPPGLAFRFGHRVAGVIAAATTLALLMELFFQFMGVAFRCPGCAG